MTDRYGWSSLTYGDAHDAVSSRRLRASDGGLEIPSSSECILTYMIGSRVRSSDDTPTQNLKWWTRSDWFGADKR